MRSLVGGNASTYIHKLKTAPTVAGTTYNTQQCRIVPWPIRPLDGGVDAIASLCLFVLPY